MSMPLRIALLLALLGNWSLAMAQALAPSPAPSATASPAAAQPLVVLIGGLDSDPSPSQIAGTAARGAGNSGMYQLAGDLKSSKLQPEYFNWNGTRAGEITAEMPPRAVGIAQFVRAACTHNPQQPLIIVGNSWGGHTACEVCEELCQEPAISIELLVLLDPSSTGRETPVPKKLAHNVKQATNYATRNLFVWREWIQEPRVTYIDLGDPAAGYLAAERKYDATFDFQAHVAAEWDARIHADICRRILDIQPPQLTPSAD